MVRTTLRPERTVDRTAKARVRETEKGGGHAAFGQG
jgi:hypothetical protein